MKLGEYLEQAVLTQNWQMVCDVHYKITGKKISPPKPKLKLADLDMDSVNENDEQEVEPEPEMANDEPSANSDDDEEEMSPPKPHTIEEFKIQHGGYKTINENGEVRAKKSPLIIPDKRINQFVDDMTIKPDESVKERPELGVKAPRPRERKRVDKVEVVCAVCHRREKVVPALAIGYSANADENTYKCNDCCSGKRH